MNTIIIKEEFAICFKANYTDDIIKITFEDLRKAEIGASWTSIDFDAPCNAKYEYKTVFTIVYKNSTGCCVCRQLYESSINKDDEECTETELLWFQYAKVES